MQDELGKKQFFITPEHPCSYLPDRDAQTLFFDPRETISATVYQRLTENGFRRSGSHLYRPYCKNCSACVPSRIPVKSFKPNRSQRRTSARNSDVMTVMAPAAFSHQFYDLYRRYIAGRHMDGDMYPPSEDQFRSFLLSQWSETQFMCSYVDDQLIAVAVTDIQQNAASAIYTFFDPDSTERSPGVNSILRQIEFCRGLRWNCLLTTDGFQSARSRVPDLFCANC
jgi:arginine-tRNA-protein transferase